MGYQISYSNGGSKNIITEKRIRLSKKALSWMFAIFITTMFFLLLRSGSIERLIIPGNTDVTKRAFEELMLSVKSGTDLGDAITAFCVEIIQSAR